MNVSENTGVCGKCFLKMLPICCCCFLLIIYGYFTWEKIGFIIDFDTPKELREMTTVSVAYQFAYGNNPYAVSVLDNEMPAVTSIYGLLVPLLMAPFIRLFSEAPLSVLQICQMLTLFVEVIGTVFFYRLLRRKTENIVLSLCGAFLFQTCYWRYAAFGGAFPDQWGLTLSVILMDFISVDERRSHYRPLLYSIVIIGLFYSKQYFILSVIGLCAYLYLHSQKDFMQFLFYGAFLGTLSVVIIYYLFPLYFVEVFPVAHGQTITGDPAYSYEQIKNLSLYYGPVVMLAMIGFMINICQVIRTRRLRGEITYELCQIIFILPPLFQIAENQGTNYTYYLQLWYPYVILYGIVAASVLLKYCHQKSTALLHDGCTKAIFLRICYIVICMLCVFSLVRVLPSYRCTFLNREQKQSWYHAYEILDYCASEGEILVSMVLSNYCLERGIATSNYGQAEYNNLQNLENYKNNRLWRNIFLFDDTEALLKQNISYNKTIKNNIYNQAYRCIALVYPGEYHLAEEDLIKAGYQISAAEELTTGTQSWYTVFYTLVD